MSLGYRWLNYVQESVIAPDIVVLDRRVTDSLLRLTKKLEEEGGATRPVRYVYRSIQGFKASRLQERVISGVFSLRQAAKVSADRYIFGMDDIFPGDRVKFTMRPRGTEYEPEELTFTVAKVDFEHYHGSGYHFLESAAGEEYEEHITGNIEIVSRPNAPWVDGIEVQGIVDPLHLDAAGYFDSDIKQFKGRVFAFRIGSIANQWISVDHDEGKNPLVVPISVIIAGRITILTSAYAMRIQSQAFEHKDEPLDGYSREDWLRQCDESKARAHFEDLTSWNAALLENEGSST